jgi:molybdate transport system substrate-binding protein
MASSYPFLQAQSFTVAAAADLRYAMDEIIKTYKSEKLGITIDVIYGSSGNLYQQISNNAPFDIFFSADNSYPLKLYEQNLTIEKPVIYAIGHLVLWSKTMDVSKGIGLLKYPEVKKIAIANPDFAPYGKRAVECLKYYKIYDQVKDKIVKGDNVSQAAQFVLSGNADAGLIALSLALSPGMSGKGNYFNLYSKSYSRAEQSYVVLKTGKIKEQIPLFVKFLKTKKVKEIFGKFGFSLPEESK